MDMSYEENDSGLKHFSSVHLSYLYYSVKFDLNCSSCNLILPKETIWLQPMLPNSNPSNNPIFPVPWHLEFVIPGCIIEKIFPVEELTVSHKNCR